MGGRKCSFALYVVVYGETSTILPKKVGKNIRKIVKRLVKVGEKV